MGIVMNVVGRWIRWQSGLREEAGLTLPELLVALIIVGLLAAIAIPSFVNQQAKAHDANAKADVRTAMQAMAEYTASSVTGYNGADVGELRAIQPDLNDALLTVDAVADKSYTLHVETASTPPASFTVAYDDGAITRSCTPAGTGGCKSVGTDPVGSW